MNAIGKMPADQQKIVSAQKIERNLFGLTEALFDEVDMLREGNGNPERVQQLCLLCNRITSILNLEMRFRETAERLGVKDHPRLPRLIK